ncbi:MAG TPA: 1,2-phenylacetyl-CoA epoxidase subunit PaaE [Bryobacteraceae bacterium]|jgi:ring-1,2-phenylacetyl-CoA epoxidase subunit PaaE|nr:1,2-phenylacetyl-CoA epoxidase subunit PaaE [Bryobacteraceae bacterium]
MSLSVIEPKTGPAGRSSFYPLLIRAVEPETAEAIVVTFDVPQPWRELFRFTQGQHLTLRARIGGEEVRRSYSICSAVQDQTLRVAIKLLPGGVFSQWAAANLKAGATLEVMPPAGHFYVPLAAENRKHYAAFAAGSGITPVLSILKTTLIAEPRSSFALFYGNRTSESILFRDELADLKDQFLGRFQLAHVLTREHQECELFNGRLTPEKCEMLLNRLGCAADLDAIFICGPQQMAEALARKLKAMGVPESRVKIELFSAAAAPPKPTVTAPAAAAIGDCEVTLTADGRQRSFTMARGGESILDAALKRGIELRYSCKSGVCATCRSKLIAGQVEMDVNYSLEPEEVRRGFVLTCQSHPLTNQVKLDFDQDN